MLIKKIIIKKITYIISIMGLSCFLLGWSSFLHRLHREDEEESVWKDFGIINDYVEWKIIPPESKVPKNKQDSDAMYLFPKEDRVIEGSFVINKKIAPSAYKSQIRLVAKDIEEYKLREKR